MNVADSFGLSAGRLIRRCEQRWGVGLNRSGGLVVIPRSEGSVVIPDGAILQSLKRAVLVRVLVG